MFLRADVCDVSVSEQLVAVAQKSAIEQLRYLESRPPGDDSDPEPEHNGAGGDDSDDSDADDLADEGMDILGTYIPTRQHVHYPHVSTHIFDESS